MKAEVDAVVARQQERVADWEAAVAEEEAALAAKQQELQAGKLRFSFPFSSFGCCWAVRAAVHGICAYAAYILPCGSLLYTSLIAAAQAQDHVSLSARPPGCCTELDCLNSAAALCAIQQEITQARAVTSCRSCFM